MLLSLFALLPTVSIATFVVPLPNGPYGVSIQDALFTDYGLSDPYLNLTYRRVPVSIISPTGSSADCEPILQPYMPNLTAKFWETEFRSTYGLPINNTLTQTELILCKPTTLNYSTPVVLFAPGAGVSRYLYNILGMSLVAQTGYTIITYDAPGQTGVVEYPDGTIQYAANASVSQTFTNSHAIAIVVEDGIVVLDAVFPATESTTGSRANVSVEPILPAALTNVTKAAMIGHSQGGAASLAGLLADARLSSGVNMDGGLNVTANSVAVCSDSDTSLNCTTSTTNKPFMIVEHQGSNQTTADGWSYVWADVLQGSKWQVQLNHSQHTTYGDFPYIADLYGLREKVNASLVNAVVGSVPGAQVMEVLSELFGAFIGYGFDGSSGLMADNVTATVAELEAFGLEIVNQTFVG